MHHVGVGSEGCPGCGGKGHHMCAIRKCAAEHGGVEYCFQCSEYPCERYETESEYDSFISYRNVIKDFAKAAGAAALFQAMADERDVSLRLRRKPK